MKEWPAATEGTAYTDRPGKAFSRLGLSFFVMLVITYGAQIVLSVAVSYSGLKDPVILLALSYAPMYCIAWPAAYLMMRAVPVNPLEQQTLGGKRIFFRLLVICFFLMYGGNLFGTVVNSVISEMLGVSIADPVESLVLSGIPMPALFVLTVILAPFFEELMFRKFLIDRMNVYGQGTAIVTTALMFGLFHGNLSQFFYAMALGLVFGYVYTRTGKLRHSVLMHMIINFWGGIVSGMLVTDESVKALINGSFDPGNIAELERVLTPSVILFSVYTMATLALAVAGFVLCIKDRRRISLDAAGMQLPEGTAFRTVWLNPGMLLFALSCLLMMVFTIFSDQLL